MIEPFRDYGDFVHQKDERIVCFNVSNTEGAIYSVDSTVSYSSIKGMIESTLYAGIEGSGTATINVDEPINLARSFSFDSIIFDGEQTEQKPDEDPIGINLSGSRDDITITIENSELQSTNSGTFRRAVKTCSVSQCLIVAV